MIQIILSLVINVEIIKHLLLNLIDKKMDIILQKKCFIKIASIDFFFIVFFTNFVRKTTSFFIDKKNIFILFFVLILNYFFKLINFITNSFKYPNYLFSNTFLSNWNFFIFNGFSKTIYCFISNIFLMKNILIKSFYLNASHFNHWFTKNKLFFNPISPVNNFCLQR